MFWRNSARSLGVDLSFLYKWKRKRNLLLLLRKNKKNKQKFFCFVYFMYKGLMYYNFWIDICNKCLPIWINYREITNDVHNILLVDNVDNLDGILDHLEAVASYALDHPSYNPLLLDTQLMDLHVEWKLFAKQQLLINQVDF